MKIVQINTFPYKATGSIMMGIHRLLIQEGHESYVVWGRGREPQNEHEISIRDDVGVKFHGVYTRLTDRTGFASWNATRKLILELEKINPDIIHLHNVHGYYLNIEMLFDYIKKNHIKLVWTLHDCWPMTGHCAYFDMVCCDKWMSGCHHCEQKSTYPASKILDSSKWNWKKKKELFSGLNAHIVTPCNWLKKIVEKSFLNEYPVNVIYNGINTEVFYPKYNKELRNKYSPDGNPIVLGVASEWTERKGLADFISLAEKYKDVNFVVVGVTAEQARQLPKEITGICRTNNVDELVELYSTADVFFNPTYEDNFPTTNLEALACGTPIVTYDTGGSPEVIESAFEVQEKVIGIVVRKSSSKTVDLKKVIEEIRRMIGYVNRSVVDEIDYHDLISEETECSKKSFDNRKSQLRKECRRVALMYRQEQRFSEYLDIYRSILS